MRKRVAIRDEEIQKALDLLSRIADRAHVRSKKKKKKKKTIYDGLKGGVALGRAEGHTHTATLDEDGNGTSSRNNEHRHVITAGKVQPAGVNNHVHPISTRK